MERGDTAAEALEALLAEDALHTVRQVGVVDARGGVAVSTGPDCIAHAGDATGATWSCQANMMERDTVPAAMSAAFEAATGDLAARLMAALQAAQGEGGDVRGRQSAALLVVSEGAGYAGLDDVAADLRVDDHPDPVTELGRLLDLNDFYLTASTEAEKIDVTPELAAELDDLARAAGHPDLQAWAGTQNYEMRVAEDGSWIDRRVLEILRREKGGSA
jgi:uncharacterized Ntn-hydrolase superfamily protein